MAIKINGTTVIDDSQNWTGADIPVSGGGTGVSTLTANNLVVGNGTSAVQLIAPGIAGNILTSNGSSWIAATTVISGTEGYKFFSAF